MSDINRLHGVLARRIGRMLASVRLSVVSRSVEDGRGFYLKRRRIYAPGLILVANGLFESPFRVLSQPDWLAWEPAIYRRVYGLEVTVVAGGLKLPELPGVPLTTLLHRADLSVQGQLRAIAAAADALQRLHKQIVRFPSGVVGAFSHADATAHNILYDSANETARWFDFETIHSPALSPVQRHADDLRTLSYSVAACLPENELPALANVLVTSYPDRLTLLALAQLVEQMRPDCFFYAQTGIGERQQARWQRELLARLALVTA